MDFSFSEEQLAVRDLARQILEDQVTQERLREVEQTDERVDRKLWQELANAGLLGIALPSEAGGSGLGFLELCLLLEQVGRTVAPVPVLPTLVLGAAPLARFGTPAQQERDLPGVVAGDRILTAALHELGADPLAPTTTARPGADGTWTLDGAKVCVPVAHVAERVLVPARVGEGDVAVFLVEPGAAGVTLAREQTPSGQPELRMDLAGVAVAPDDVLAGPDSGRAALQWIVERATAGLCAIAAGVCQQAVRMTADYTKTRHQFDKPIASFQAVGQRAADAYIDAEGVTLTMWQAAWRLSEELPATSEVAVAKFWASEGSQRVALASQHLHGGIGVDRDYALHRYFLWGTQAQLAFGGATAQLARLGAVLAAEPA